ncbi:hypothetical protein [Methyloferula stellata]|uniref:hypothetical protein n=1 Tax=Methyloferula stellata TaxID=876270 RepID=UPI0003A9D712|nr:hypothetical protein [Methyloferula stellata]
MSVISMCRREAASSLLRPKAKKALGGLCVSAGAVFLAITVSGAAQARPAAAERVHHRVFGAAFRWQPHHQYVRHFGHWTRHGHWTHYAHFQRHGHATRYSAASATAGYGYSAATPDTNDSSARSGNWFDTMSSNASSVLSEASRWIGQGNVTGSHRAWCADFANFVLQRTGHKASGSGMVSSMLHVGQRVATPAKGDLVVMRSHVTIFAGYGGRGFYGLGGNQHHQVRMSNFPLSSVVAFVRPS